MGVGDVLRNVAQKVDPSPSETMISITAEGKERAKQLLGQSQLGLILNHLDEFSPQSVTEIAHSTEMNIKVVQQQIKAYPHYFTVRVR